MLGILKKSEAPQGKFILLVASDFKMAAIAEPAIRGQKYFGWLSFFMKGLIAISFKKIGDFQFHSLFVTYRDSLLIALETLRNVFGYSKYSLGWEITSNQAESGSFFENFDYFITMLFMNSDVLPDDFAKHSAWYPFESDLINREEKLMAY